MEGQLLALTLVLMFVGLIGSVLPGIPGVTLVLLFISRPIASVAVCAASSHRARRFGASNWGTVGGAVGGIAGALIGLLFLGIGSLFGLIVGTIAGVFIGEYLRRERHGDREEQDPAEPDWHRASRAAGGVMVGYLASAVVQGFLGLASVVIF